jgi:HemY protein
MAAVAKGGGDDAAARDWLVLAATAPREPDWSDVEPDGLPFMYTDDDWARLVHVFGDSGQMIHPRYERYRPEALPTPSASLLPTVARISQYAEVPADFGVYQGGAGGGDYVPRLAHVLEAEIADDMQDASEDVEVDFDDDDDKKRSVLSWFRRG